MVLIAGGSAVLTAIFVGYVAHYDFGLSREQIRLPAVCGAAVIAVLMAIKFFGHKFRKP